MLAYLKEQAVEEEWTYGELWEKQECVEDFNVVYRKIRNGFSAYRMGVVVGECDAPKGYDVPPFGAVLLFLQTGATDWNGYFSCGADTTADNCFVLISRDGQQTMKVPKDADICFVSIEDVILDCKGVNCGN